MPLIKELEAEEPEEGAGADVDAKGAVAGADVAGGVLGGAGVAVVSESEGARTWTVFSFLSFGVFLSGYDEVLMWNGVTGAKRVNVPWWWRCA